MEAGENEELLNGSLKTHVSEIETLNPQYEQLLADVWVGIVLTLLLLSCVCCMCSCLLYHKFQQWKRAVLRNGEETGEMGSVNGMNLDCESLPSYTMASGLPTYEEALQQMEKRMEKTSSDSGVLAKPDTNIAIHMSVIQSVSKGSLFNYLNGLVQEKT